MMYVIVSGIDHLSDGEITAGVLMLSFGYALLAMNQEAHREVIRGWLRLPSPDADTAKEE